MIDGLTLALGCATAASLFSLNNARLRAISWERTADYWRGEYIKAAYSSTVASDAPTHLLCGACGLSVPTTDGFTIAEHNCCQPELFSSTGVAQREM